jgi:integrase
VEGVLRKDLLPQFSDKPFIQFTRSDAVKVHDKVSKRAPVVANRLKKYASAMWEWHMDRDESIEVNPWHRVKVNSEKPRDRTLTNAELKSVLLGMSEIDDDYRAVLLGCLYTGCRVGEVTNFRRSWVEGDWIVIPSAYTKNGRKHHVFVTRQLKAVLDAATSKGDLIFPAERRPESPVDTRVISRHLRVSGYQDTAAFTSHDLRRTMATWLGEQESCEPHVIDRMLNHADNSVTGEHYNHAKLRKPAARWWQVWADHLTGLTSDKVTPMKRQRA